MKMINKSTTRRNYLRLLEYEQELHAKLHLGELPDKKKLTLNIDRSYHDVVKRICLLEGISKTEAIRRAINIYSDLFGDDVLFPSHTDPQLQPG
jgi:hypothetical protein